MSALEWAKREIKYAKLYEKKTLAGGQPKDPYENCLFDYEDACRISALKAFKSLIKDSHSGTSINHTKNILNRLIDGKPLSPIEDTDDMWIYVTNYNPEKGTEVELYQCTRMSGLFKYIHANGRVEYNDINSHYCVKEGSTVGAGYHSSLVQREIIDKMFPIIMPYMPPERKIKVYCEDFLVSKDNGDFDTVGILYLIDYSEQKIQINRFFKEIDNEWVEISDVEYNTRKINKVK